MRLVICCIGVLVTSFTLVACGQSGALQHPNDQNLDKRSKYLLYSYPDDQKKQKDQAEGNTSVEESASEAVASEVVSKVTP